MMSVINEFRRYEAQIEEREKLAAVGVKPRATLA